MRALKLNTLLDQIESLIKQKQNLGGNLSEGLNQIKLARQGNMLERTPQIPKHRAELDTAIGSISKPELHGLVAALKDVYQDLRWVATEGAFYPEGSALSPSYMAGNMHTVLIGPATNSPPCVYQSDNLIVGFFLLTPEVLYRDHRHASEETYINLTPASGWRLNGSGGDGWFDLGEGSVVYNPPMQIHATRTYDTPWLSLFVWTGDVKCEAEVTYMPDWEK